MFALSSCQAYARNSAALFHTPDISRERIYVAPLTVFAVAGFAQVGQSVRYFSGWVSTFNFKYSAFEAIEKQTCMCLLLRCRFLKYGCNLFVTFFAGGFGK